VDEDKSTVIVDAIFPAQFDNHICTLDTVGILRFWDVANGISSTVVTGIGDVRAFCFGSEQWGRFGVFAATSDQLAMVFPVAPQRCCALRCEVAKLRRTCVEDLHHERSSVVVEQVTMTMQWLDNTFPDMSDDKDDSWLRCTSKTSWIEANERRNQGQSPICSKFAPLKSRGGTPVQICVLDEGIMNVLVIATDNGQIDVIISSDVFIPTWRATTTFKLYRAESFCILKAVRKTTVRLEAFGSNIYYVHDRGVALLDVRWIESLKSDLNIADFDSLLTRKPSYCRHIIFSSNQLNNVVGACLFRNTTLSSTTMLCWFDNSSCCTVDIAASRYALDELSNDAPRDKTHVLHLADELVAIIDNINMTLERLPADAVDVVLPKDNLNQLNTRCATLETNVALKLQHCAKHSTSIAHTLKLIRDTQRHQLDYVHKMLNAVNITFETISSAVKTVVVRQKAIRSRAAILVAVAAVLHPCLSKAEQDYLYDLKALDVQCTRVFSRINAEKRHINACADNIEKHPFLIIDDNQYHLAKQLLAGQTHILQTSNRKLEEFRTELTPQLGASCKKPT